MKTHKHVWDFLLRDDTIEFAIINAADGKNKNNKRHKTLRYIRDHKEEYTPIVREWIINYDPKEHKRVTKTINDGLSAKMRNITIPTVIEEIILNAVCLVFKKTLMPSMYEHSYSSIPGKGTHLAAHYISKWLKRDCINTQYAFQSDIYHFFESVNRGILFRKLKRKYKESLFIDLCRKIVYATPGAVGLPLGFPTSQWFANFYMTDFDHYVKEQLKAPYYVRFSDDMLVMCSNKEDLWRYKDAFDEYLNSNLVLRLKPNWKIFPLDHSNPNLLGNKLDFLGYKHARDYKTLRKKILKRYKRKIFHVKKKGKINIKDARQLVTYAGYLKHASCYGWYLKYVKPNVSMRYMRKKISNYSKKGREESCGTKP